MIDEAFSLKNTKIELDITKDSHGWIQFKGTDLCMDIHCKCGYFGHIDDDFVYYIQCPMCKTVYELNGHIQFIERPDMTGDEDVCIKKQEIED